MGGARGIDSDHKVLSEDSWSNVEMSVSNKICRNLEAVSEESLFYLND